MTSPSTRKPPQNPVKHQAILDAAIEVFAGSGFADTDVETVAQQAGVGKGTVYRYFGDKKGLFRAAADQGMKQLESHILTALGSIEDPVEAIGTVGSAYGSYFVKRPEVVEIMLIERAEFRGSIPDTHLVYRAKNRTIFEDILRRGIEAGQFRQVDVRQATDVFANALFGTVVCGCLEAASVELERMAGHCVEIFLRGISNRDGQS